MENVGLSVDFHCTLMKSSRPLIYLMSAGFGCSSDSSMVSFGNPLIFFSLSSIFNRADVVHSACTLADLTG